MQLDIDLILILGTSLTVHGIQKLTKNFAKLAHKNNGHVLFINTTEPPRSQWDGVIDYWVKMQCDNWVRDLTMRDLQLHD